MSIYLGEGLGKNNPTKKQQQWIEDIETTGVVIKSAKKAIEAFKCLQKYRYDYDLAFLPINNVDGSYVIVGEKFTPPPQQSMSNSVKKKFTELEEDIKEIKLILKNGASYTIKDDALLHTHSNGYVSMYFETKDKALDYCKAFNVHESRIYLNDSFSNDSWYIDRKNHPLSSPNKKYQDNKE